MITQPSSISAPRRDGFLRWPDARRCCRSIPDSCRGLRGPLSVDQFGRQDLDPIQVTLGHFGHTGADDESKHIMLSFLYKADPEYGAGVTKVAKGDLDRVKALAAKLVD